MMPSTEAISLQSELIRQARQGDAAAWESLMSEHQDRVFRLAYLFRPTRRCWELMARLGFEVSADPEDSSLVVVVKVL